MAITNDIIYVGVNDRTTDLFESQYTINDGVTYNSYVILDDKIAVFDTVSRNFKEPWMQNMEEAFAGRKPDYLIVQHMEPDHSANIYEFAAKYPEATIVSSALAFNMMGQFFGTAFEDRRLVIKEGDTLDLGKHVLTFVAAPMVHWPEVMMTYDASTKILFAADGFGRFGAPTKETEAKCPNCKADCEAFEDEPWADEARRYYIGIVGKYGPQVQSVLQKAAGLEIEKICPLHGPILTKDLGKYLKLYDAWSSYTPEESGIAVCYSSVYGHTRAAVEFLVDQIRAQANGPLPIAVFDLARNDMADAVAHAHRYDRVVLATTTYNMEIFPCMKDFISHLQTSCFQKRKVALIENGSWAPNAQNIMRQMLSECADLTICENCVTIKSAMNDANKETLIALAKELVS